MKEKTNDTASSNKGGQEKIKENMDKITHKLLVMSGKGGVGKTTVATNLAFGLALQKHTVGLLDVDSFSRNTHLEDLQAVWQLILFGGTGMISKTDT